MSFAPVRWVCASSLMCLLACGGGEVPGEVPAAAETTGAEPAPPAPAPAAEAEAEPSEAEEEAPAPAPAANVAKPAATPPRFGALITYVVKDYDAWKEIFDDQKPARKAAGIVAHTVLLHPKAKAKVTLMFAARDLDPLQAFLGDEEQKKAMEQAGVKGKPTVYVLSLVDDQTNQELSGMYSAVVKLKVADFDTWKEAFDARADARDQADLYGHAIATLADDDSTVFVYLQAREQAPLDKYLASKDFKEAMSAAGAKGAPEVTKLSEEEDETYK